MREPCVGPPGQPGQNSSRPGSGVRPSSAALAYAWGQRSTVLVAPAAGGGGDDWFTGAASVEQAAPCSSDAQQQAQQGTQHLQWPVTVGPQQQAAAAAVGQFWGRPLSAGAPLSGSQPRPYTSSSSRRPGTQPHSHGRAAHTTQHGRGSVRTAPAAPHQQQQAPHTARGANSSGTDGLGVEQLERFSSTGFAPRVKGTRFSQAGRDGIGAGPSAAAAAAHVAV